MSGIVNGANKSEKGWLSNVAGKAFAVLSVAALALPLVAIFQANGALPGDYGTESYMDVGHEIVQVVEDWQKPPIDENVGVLIPVDGQFREYYYGGYSSDADAIFDTEITGLEATVGFLSAAGFGAAGSFIGLSEKRNADKNNSAVEEQISDRYDQLYAAEKHRYLSGLPDAYDNRQMTLDVDDLGKLAAMDDADIGKLPPWMQAQVFESQRDIALAALYNHDLESEVDIGSLSTTNVRDNAAQLEVFKLQRDRVWDTVNHHVTLESNARQARSDNTSAALTGFSTGMVLGNKNARAGAGAAIAVVAVAAVAGGTIYLSGKSVYDNFFRDNPELKSFSEPDRPELISAQDEILKAREEIAGHLRYAKHDHAAPAAASPVLS